MSALSSILFLAVVLLCFVGLCLLGFAVVAFLDSIAGRLGL